MTDRTDQVPTSGLGTFTVTTMGEKAHLDPLVEYCQGSDPLTGRPKNLLDLLYH